MIRRTDGSLPMKLLRAREGVMQWFRPTLRLHDLTEQQWRVIRTLAEDGSVDMHDLARRCQVHPPSLSRIMPRLEARGIVARMTGSGDQRRVLTRLTPAGQALYATVGAAFELCNEALLARIGTARMAALGRALDDAIAILEDDGTSAAAE